jgi:AcrR family transcriptional regulator
MRRRDPEKGRVIRENAFRMFFEEGFSGFSMHKLAKASGVSPATLYIYFKDKDDLIMQLYAEEMQKLTSATLKGFDASMPFAEGLRIQWMNRARYYLANPYPAHFLEQVRYTPFHDRAMNLIDPHFLKQMKTFVNSAIRNGELVDVPVEIYWAVAFAPLYQLIKYDLHGVSFPGRPRFRLNKKSMNRALDLVLKALKP